MGHREDLLEGAKKCLHEKGYARTTARDIVAASGTNLASIGYHFGSKEALLNAALLEASSEMAAELVRVTTDSMTIDDDAGLAHGWDAAIARFAKFRPLLVAEVEAWAQIERSPELRAELANHYDQERTRGIADARKVVPGLDDRTAKAVTTVTNALADGLVVQWLLDPDRTPSGEEIARGIEALAQFSAQNSPNAETTNDAAADNDETAAT